MWYGAWVHKHSWICEVRSPDRNEWENGEEVSIRVRGAQVYRFMYSGTVDAPLA